MIQPWAQTAWELDGDIRSFYGLVAAAHALASRFDPRVDAIRSWDRSRTKRYHFGDLNQDFLLIIDNMMGMRFLLPISFVYTTLALPRTAPL
jgi:hypothetical protein